MQENKDQKEFKEKLLNLLDEYEASMTVEAGDGVFIDFETGDAESFYFETADSTGFDT
jgi:hypothetical protein